MRYYRTSDEQVVDVSADVFGELAPQKQAVHREYSVDPVPSFTTTQRVVEGPVVVTETAATKTWSVIEKTQAEKDEDAENAQRLVDYAQARAVYVDLRNGVGTAAERLARVEKVLSRLLRDAIGKF